MALGAALLLVAAVACETEDELTDPATYPSESLPSFESPDDYTAIQLDMAVVEPCPTAVTATVTFDTPNEAFGILTHYPGGTTATVEALATPPGPLAVAIYGPDDGNGWFGGEPMAGAGGGAGTDGRPLQIGSTIPVDGYYVVVVTAIDPAWRGDVAMVFGAAGCSETACPDGCDDGDPCTEDACAPELGFCVHEPIEGCGATDCTEDSACDDGNDCTLDICDPGVGCRHMPVDGCGAGCSEDSVCDDGNICTVDTCDATTGQCVNLPAPDGAACDDGDPCTTDDVCAVAECVGAPLACDDGDDCTDDSCDPATGSCEHFAVPGCGHPACRDDADCDDGDDCTADACDPATGQCQHLAVPGCGHPACRDDAECDDANPCTFDTCDPAVGCVHTTDPDGMACDDGDVCTANDVCSVGVCVGAPLDCDDGDPCTSDMCDPAAGCHHVPLPDPGCGQPGCASDEECDDANPCTHDVCDAATGQCLHTNVPCD